MKLSVVCPSRLAVNPESQRGALYIERAIASVRSQTVAQEHAIFVFAGLDDDDKDLKLVSPFDAHIAIGGHSQATAVNAAAQMAMGAKPDFLAFLEDDDIWHPQKLEYQLAALAQGYGFVSCSQREVTPDGSYVRVNDFPTMSGWIMPAQTWRDVGPMDESFKWHIDNEWLGRLNAAGKKRLHLAEHAAVPQHHELNMGTGEQLIVSELSKARSWLAQVGKFSKLAMTDDLLEPLVTRTVNPGGGMARIATDPIANAESFEEHRRMWETNGAVIPW